MKTTLALNLVASLLLTVVLTACQKSVTTPPRAATAQEIGHAKKFGNFSVVVPDKWTAFSKDDPIIRDPNPTKPKVKQEADMLNTAKQMLAGPMFRLIAFDPNSSKPGFVNNLNVLVTQVPAGTTNETIVEQSKKMIGILGKVSEEKDAVYGGVRFHHMRIESDSSPTPGKGLTIRSYFSVMGTENVTFTFSSTKDADPSFAKDAEAIMASFAKQ